LHLPPHPSAIWRFLFSEKCAFHLNPGLDDANARGALTSKEITTMKKKFTSAFFLAAFALFAGTSALYANNPVIGIIDSVSRDSAYYPWHHVKGWACAYGLPNSIGVHVYAGGPAGVGQYVTSTTANLASDQYVAAACGSNGTAYRFSIALDGFLAAHYGKSLYIHGISPNGGPNYLLSNSGSFTFPDGISATVFGHLMRIRTRPAMAGAITSLTWKGKEFVNSDDHGRNFQMAAQFNGHYECYNPTEGGSLSDGGANSPSTSQVTKYTISAPNLFYTNTYAAFWLRPGEGQFAPVWGNCNSPGKAAVNTTWLSNYIFYKTITAGHVLQNVIKVYTAVYIPEAVNEAAIESFVGLMNNADFPKVMLYNIANGTATVVDPNGQTWVNSPIILASNDNQYAFGIYNRQLIAPNNPTLGVGHFRWNLIPEYGVNAWSSVFNFGATAGPYSRSFNNYLVIGTLQDVLNSMATVHNNPSSFP
jgi:hypothetical protein